MTTETDSPKLTALLMDIHRQLATLEERTKHLPTLHETIASWRNLLFGLEGQGGMLHQLRDELDAHKEQVRLDFLRLNSRLDKFTDERRIRSFWNPARRRRSDLKVWHGVIVLLSALIALAKKYFDLWR